MDLMAHQALLLYAACGLAGLVLLLFIIVLVRQERGRVELAARVAHLAQNQQTSEHQMAQRLVEQERAVQQQLDRVSQRVGSSIENAASKTHESLATLRERLAQMDEAHRNITALSSQMLSLQNILSNKQARGAFGEIQLRDLVENVLPPGAFTMQAALGNGLRADCLIALPNPPGPIAIDAKFPLESFQRLVAAENEGERAAATRQFASDIRVHVRAIHDKYIVPGETGEAALLFLPSEAVYAELHARHAEVVAESFRERVFIVSPTTLWATLNTIRAIFRDVRMREQSDLLQKQCHLMLEDIARLDERVDKLARHFRQTGEAVDGIQTSARKVTAHAERIRALDFEPHSEDAPAIDPATASPSLQWLDPALRKASESVK